MRPEQSLVPCQAHGEWSVEVWLGDEDTLRTAIVITHSRPSMSLEHLRGGPRSAAEDLVQGGSSPRGRNPTLGSPMVDGGPMLPVPPLPAASRDHAGLLLGHYAAATVALRVQMG